jgi:hypothetical protein
MRGFISPLKFNVDSFWMDETSALQNTPRAGVPRASQNSPMILQASGLMNEGDIVQVRTVRAGHVGLEGRSQLQFRPGESGDWYGRDAYNICSYWERVAGSNTIQFRPRDAIQASDGSVYVTVEKQDGSDYDVMVIKRTPQGTFETPISLYTFSGSIAEGFLHSGICEMEDGSLIVAHWSIDGDRELAQINIHKSEDAGASWSQVSTDAIANNIWDFPIDIQNKGSFGIGTAGADLSRIRIRSIGGQTLMTLHIIKHNNSLGFNQSILYQYLSTNGGLTFEQVAENDDGGFFNHDLQVVNGGFNITFVEFPASPRVLVLARLASASSPIASAVRYDISTNTNLQNGGANNHESDLSAWIDTDGKYYAVARMIQGTTADQTLVFQSEDGGYNWSQMGIGSSSVFVNYENSSIHNSDSASNLYLTQFVGCSQGGEGLLFHNTAGTAASAYDEVLGCFQIGGYSTVTAPPYRAFSGDTERMRWSVNWIPLQLPGSLGWTAVGTGVQTLNNGYVNITTTALTQRYYRRSGFTGTLDNGIVARVRITLNTGTILKPILQLQISDGSSTSYKVSVRASETQLDLYDEIAGAQIGPLRLVDNTLETDILIGISGSNVYAWYRGNSSGSPRTWSNLGDTSSLTSGTATSNYIYFGAIGNGSIRDLDLHECHFSFDAMTGLQLAFGQTGRELWSRPYPGLGYSVKLDGDLFISTRDGATQEVDTWQIEPRFDYPLDNMIYTISPSKRTPWRSPVTSPGPNPTARIALYVDPSQEVTELENDILGVCLENVNFQNFKIQRHNGSAWIDIGTVDNSVYSGGFTRTGAAIFSSASPGAVQFPYLMFNECQGWRVKLDDGEGNITFRKIASNSEGPFIQTSSKFAVLTLEGIDGSEPTSGTATIIPDSVATVIYLDNQSTSWRDTKAIGIEITSQETLEEYLQIGLITAGPLFVPGRQYSRGRQITETQSIEDIETLDGTIFSRNTGNNGRTVRISWTDGVDISGLFEENPEPDYWRGSNRGDAIANWGDAPEALQGFYRYLEGGIYPTVYIPSFGGSIDGDNQVQVFNRRGDHMTSRISRPVQITNILGDEMEGLGSGEVYRVGSIILEEIK